MSERPFRPHPKPEARAKTGPTGFDRPRPARVTPEKASEMAISALAWLAGDPERLDRFLAVTGIDHGGIRQAAQEPGFLAAVLDHLCADEEALLAFAADSQLRPEQVAGAREILSGPSEWQSI